jgi:transposase
LRRFESRAYRAAPTLVAGLRLRGLVAQKAFDRPINAASFEQWVEKCLVPALSKGDIVVMDNLSSHKGERIEQLIMRPAPNCDTCGLTAPT